MKFSKLRNIVIEILTIFYFIQITNEISLRKRGKKSQKPVRLTDVRNILNSEKKIKYPSRNKNPRLSTDFKDDPLPELLSDIVKELSGQTNCHLLLYYDSKAVSESQLNIFRNNINVPVTLLDVVNLKFSLITKKNLLSAKTPLVKLLLKRPDSHRCRILVAWASEHYQRGLLIIARKEPGVLKPQDTIILPAENERIGRFLPTLKNKVIVRKVKSKPKRRGSRAISQSKYVIDRSCVLCHQNVLIKIGEWKQFDGWVTKLSNKFYSILNGTTLTVSFTKSIPNVFFKRQNGKSILDGLEIRMLQYAAQALNFSIRYIQPR